MGELCDNLKVNFANHAIILTNGIWGQYERREGTDLVIMCQGGERVSVHRWLIQILVPQLLESSKKKLIKMDIEKTTLTSVLEFLYKGNVQIADTDLEKFRLGAQMFQLNHLLEAIKKHSAVITNKINNESSTQRSRVKPAVLSLSNVKKAVKCYRSFEPVSKMSARNSCEAHLKQVEVADVQQVIDEQDLAVEELPSVQQLVQEPAEDIFEEPAQEQEMAGVVVEQFSEHPEEQFLNFEQAPYSEVLDAHSGQIFSSGIPVLLQTLANGTLILQSVVGQGGEEVVTQSELVNEEGGSFQIYSVESQSPPDKELTSIECRDADIQELVIDLVEEEVVANDVIEAKRNFHNVNFTAEEMKEDVEETLEGESHHSVLENSDFKVLSVTKVTLPVESLLKGVGIKRKKIFRLKRIPSSAEFQTMKSKKMALRIIRSKGISKSVLDRNVNREKKRRQFCKVKVRCVRCEYVAKNIYDLDFHMSREHPGVHKDRSRRCTYCDFVAEHMLALFTHLKTVHKHVYKMEFACNQCDFVSEKKGFLARHVRNEHSTDRPFACDQCDYRGMSRKNLLLHRQLHLETKYACETCGKLFNCQIYLRKHRKLHSEVFLGCPLCSHPFRQRQSLKLHLQRKHNMDSETLEQLESLAPKAQQPIPKVKCPLCEYMVPQRKFIVNHLAAQHHVDEQLNPIQPTISCSKCEFVCYIQSQLTTHIIKTHRRYKSDERVAKKVACDICGNFLSSKPHLKRHIEMMHNPEPTLHMCNLCGFTTKTKGNLTQHFKRKHDESVVTIVQVP